MDKRPILDCATCWKRDKCERAQEGTFCTEWQSKEPKERHPTPDELWETGAAYSDGI